MLFLLLACTGATKDDTAGDDTASGRPLTLSPSRPVTASSSATISRSS